MSQRRIAVIMAGGSGERFWPVSTKERPKQFLRLSDPQHSLLAEAVDRAAGMFGASATYVATGAHLVGPSVAEAPGLPSENVLAEPAKRNTTGCLVWVTASLIATRPEDWATTTIAVLTADHRIGPADAFLGTVSDAMSTAEQTGGLVTIGIRPSRPETGFGYIEVGERVGVAARVVRFREKPNLETAEVFLASGGFLWNSGMFFWTLPAFLRELETAQPEIANLTREIAALLACGKQAEASALFETLPNLSIDFALMEPAQQVYVVEARFDWDDLGAWDAVARSYPLDAQGNATIGGVRTIEAGDNVVFNESPGQEVCLLGVTGLVVVVTETAVMVCPKDRAQEVKRFQSR